MINMKALHTIPRRSYIKIHGVEDIIFFDHIDGAYSYCKTKDGEVVHISAWALVKIVDKPEDWEQK